jgi:hypothetical protein
MPLLASRTISLAATVALRYYRSDTVFFVPAG